MREIFVVIQLWVYFLEFYVFKQQIVINVEVPALSSSKIRIGKPSSEAALVTNFLNDLVSK